MEGNKNGLFREALLRAWNTGRFEGGYHHFRTEIAGFMPPTQSPKYTIVGHRERAFERAKAVLNHCAPSGRCGMNITSRVFLGR